MTPWFWIGGIALGVGALICFGRPARIRRSRPPASAPRPQGVPISRAMFARGPVPADGRPLTKAERGTFRLIEANFARTAVRPAPRDGDSR